MKLNKDNFELMMFDLLEGNLSERDALGVMKQIEEDEFFFKQWKLFKSTILIADKDVVFEGKDQLLKNEGGAIPLFKWATIAVAASLVLAVFFFWPTTPVVDVAEETPMGVIEAPSDPNEEKGVLTEEPVLIAEEVKKEDLFDVQRNTPAPVRNKVVKKQRSELVVQETLNETIEVPVPEAELTPLKRFEEQIAIEIPKAPKEIIAIDEPKEEVNDVSKEEKPEAIADATLSPDYKENKINFKSLVTSSSRKRIRDRAMQFIAAVSNPKVKLKPQFNGLKPGLKIELETNGYEAVASLQPFNKKKN